MHTIFFITKVKNMPLIVHAGHAEIGLSTNMFSKLIQFLVMAVKMNLIYLITQIVF